MPFEWTYEPEKEEKKLRSLKSDQPTSKMNNSWLKKTLRADSNEANE